jgi:hypothetical protein
MLETAFLDIGAGGRQARSVERRKADKKYLQHGAPRSTEWRKEDMTRAFCGPFFNRTPSPLPFLKMNSTMKLGQRHRTVIVPPSSPTLPSSSGISSLVAAGAAKRKGFERV